MYLARLCLLLSALTISALAAPFSSLIVYGDSLSDNGNLFAATGMPPAPYFQGRVSNGPVAVERLAAILGAPLLDFAWSGSTTGIGNSVDGGTATNRVTLPGVRTTFDATKGSLGALADSFVVVWAGPNDFLSPSSLDPSPLDIANRAVANILSIVNELQGLGARAILVPGMPDLGLTPFYQRQGGAVAGGATFITDYFNGNLRAGLPAGIIYFDTAGLLRSVVADPAAFGFANVTDQCFSGMSVCADPDSYLFWDDFHPTAAGHAILGEQFAATIPEPSTVTLMFAGCAALLIVRRRADRIRPTTRE